MILLNYKKAIVILSEMIDEYDRFCFCSPKEREKARDRCEAIKMATEALSKVVQLHADAKMIRYMDEIAEAKKR